MSASLRPTASRRLRCTVWVLFNSRCVSDGIRSVPAASRRGLQKLGSQPGKVRARIHPAQLVSPLFFKRRHPASLLSYGKLSQAGQIDQRRHQPALGADQDVQALPAFAQSLHRFQDRVGAAWLIERGQFGQSLGDAAGPSPPPILRRKRAARSGRTQRRFSDAGCRKSTRCASCLGMAGWPGTPASDRRFSRCRRLADPRNSVKAHVPATGFGAAIDTRAKAGKNPGVRSSGAASQPGPGLGKTGSGIEGSLNGQTGSAYAHSLSGQMTPRGGAMR